MKLYTSPEEKQRIRQRQKAEKKLVSRYGKLTTSKMGFLAARMFVVKSKPHPRSKGQGVARLVSR